MLVMGCRRLMVVLYVSLFRSRVAGLYVILFFFLMSVCLGRTGSRTLSMFHSREV